MNKTSELAKARRLIRSGRAREIREQAQLSRREIAEGIGPGVDASSVARWECGSRVPRAELALAYAALLQELSQAL